MCAYSKMKLHATHTAFSFNTEMHQTYWRPWLRPVPRWGRLRHSPDPIRINLELHIPPNLHPRNYNVIQLLQTLRLTYNRLCIFQNLRLEGGKYDISPGRLKVLLRHYHEQFCMSPKADKILMFRALRSPQSSVSRRGQPHRHIDVNLTVVKVQRSA